MSIKIKTRKNEDIGDERKFTNQNWKRVLKEIVDYAPNRYGRGKSNYGEGHPLAKRLKIKSHELVLIMSFLEEQGLIEYAMFDYNWINLTSKGFDVARQNQAQSMSFRTNFVIILLTAVIAFATALNVFTRIDDLAARYVTIGFTAGLGIIFWQVKKRTA